jgi:hypothetical protein
MKRSVEVPVSGSDGDESGGAAWADARPRRKNKATIANGVRGIAGFMQSPSGIGSNWVRSQRGCAANLQVNPALRGALAAPSMLERRS